MNKEDKDSIANWRPSRIKISQEGTFTYKGKPYYHLEEETWRNKKEMSVDKIKTQSPTKANLK